MRKTIRFNNKLIVLLDNGSYIENDNVSEELFLEVCNAETDEEVVALLDPDYRTKVKEYEETLELKELLSSSNILKVKVDSIYWEEVSGLSVPIELAKAIVEAEHKDDTLKIETYKNFWTLMSLNPDEECRKNLFWFLNKWGLKLARCGFFVAYRNVVPYEVLKDGTEVFTDYHSGTTRIKIGEVVTMPREECDRDSSHSCSRGLMCSPVY